MSSSLLVLYGSETGTSQELAEQIWREGYRRNVSVKVVSFDDFNMNTLPQQVFVVFMVSTSGQGELPANMRKNWRKLLNANIPSDWLSELKVACFGLGDSSYPKFNFAAKKVTRRLSQLGAQMVVPSLFGDDQHETGPYGLFDQFLALIWKYLANNSIFELISEVPFRKFPLKYSLRFVIKSEHDPHESLDKWGYFLVRCLSNRRMTSIDHFQDTRLIAIDVSGYKDEFTYQPGDVLMVQPRNLKSSVEVALEVFEYSDKLLDKPFRLEPTSENISKLPSWLVKDPTTLRHCFNDYFDLQTVPQRSFFATLALHSTNEQECERLQELADMRNLDEYLAYCQRPRRTVAEVLQDFPNTTKALMPETLFNLFSPIRPRAFSIASSPGVGCDTVELLVARVEYETLMSKKRQGLCSTFLASLSDGDELFVKVRPGTFRFDWECAKVLIATGTGIAPFHSLLLDKRFSTSHRARSLLFFGCRSANNDLYFNDDWTELGLTSYMAFSRPENREKKEYVQDKLEQLGAQVWQLLADGKSQVLVAGRAKDMPDAVVATLKGIAETHGQVEDADAFIRGLEVAGRLQFETWY